jgi:hypothetical protein
MLSTAAPTFSVGNNVANVNFSIEFLKNGDFQCHTIRIMPHNVFFSAVVFTRTGNLIQRDGNEREIVCIKLRQQVYSSYTKAVQ